MSVSRKQLWETIDGTPEKRLFLSIISDYDLRTGLCELIDNALDLWTANSKKPTLKVAVTLDVDRQVISVCDNAGGVQESQARLLIVPGATRSQPSLEQIGTCGVGDKRAGIALGEHVEIRSRHKKEKSIQIDNTTSWLNSADWHLDIYEIPDITSGTTCVDISKVRQGFSAEDVESIRVHLGETYSWFIDQDAKSSSTTK